ncbi:MAG TPA: DUF2093 domain-containing protein [Sphingomicrobium sp.]
MLMSGSGRAARVHYLAGTFRVLSDGDHVVCAVTGARILLHELKYWSVARQEPYVDAEASLKAEQAAKRR